jgi:hypothetical protein
VHRSAPLILLFALVFGQSALRAQTAAPSGAVTREEQKYFPLAVGNRWVYSLREHPKTAEKTIKWSCTQKERVHGKNVYHLWETPSQDDEGLSLAESLAGVAEAGTDRYLFRIPLRTGDRWNSKSGSLRAKGKMDSFEVITVGVPCSAGKHLFSDCVEIREIDEANNIASLTTYARGVGPVKYVYFKNLHSEEIDTTMIINSWEVR